MDFQDTNRIYSNYLTSTVSKEIAPDDDMYLNGKEWYFDVGASGLRCILQGLGLSQVKQVSKILDLPCGHGRVARHLRAAFPDALMSFCDLDAAGVRFCGAQFKGHEIPSRPDLTSVALGNNYDVIWIGSLFTHLDLETTKAWLAHLVASLSENGIIVATFHGQWSVEVHEHYTPLIRDHGGWDRILRGYNKNGFGYAPYDGAQPGWGVSVSTAARIIELASSLHGIRLLSYSERAWADNHDVLTIGKTDRNKPWSIERRTKAKSGFLSRTSRRIMRRVPVLQKLIKKVRKKR